MNTLNRLLVAFSLLCLPLFSEAQSFLGYHSDNYAGIHNVNFQPADIVDSRYLFDFNLAGASVFAGNDYIGMKLREALDTEGAFDDPDFQDHYLIEKLNGRAKTAHAQVRAYLPSFMFSFGKNAIAFHAKANVLANVEGVNENVAYLAYRELDYPQYWNTTYNNENLSAQAMGWIDYNFTYGREIFQIKQHYLKGAVTFKLLQGLFSAQAYSRNAQVSFPNDDFIDMIDTDLSYGHSDNFELDADGLSYRFVGKPGFGMDLGFVYELRRPAETYTYSIDGTDGNIRNDLNKYILKVGFSATDMGNIAFTRGGLSSSFYADRTMVPLDSFERNTIAEFDSVLNSYYTFSNEAGTQYKQSLPTALNFTVDYNIWKGFYANFTASVAPRQKFDPHKTRHISMFSVTPRYEWKYFGAWLPVSIDALQNFHVGAGMRLGPLVVGVYDFTTLLGRDMYDFGAYAMLRLPILYGKGYRDPDKDGVSNKRDKCRREPGSLANNGCPIRDKDSDGVVDAEDACPEVPGLATLQGCPDTDADGIADKEDKCPDLAGTAAMNGCPDADGDGITDAEDACPRNAGLPAMKGCPDGDGDGVEDSRDACPGKAGRPENAGCPDSDNDGVYDNTDKCPAEPGIAANNGCPEENPDTDGDGLRDKEDECPTKAGPRENKGCPALPKEEKEVLQTAFNNLEFESGGAVIKDVSFASLNKLAELMVKKPKYRLVVEGHTDNVGEVQANLLLSQRRAESVKAFLVKKGVNAAQITTQGFGETRPVGDNNTAAGRKLNRRVELKVVPE
jgi:outer membrane protein OmpA-like peptidoglycan-associated protein